MLHEEGSRKGRTLQQARYPWARFDVTCETWGPGSFHPMSPEGLLGPNTYVIEEIIEKVEAAYLCVSDTSLTDRFRDEARHRIEICMSWLSQIMSDSAIPLAAGAEYRNWVQTIREQNKERHTLPYEPYAALDIVFELLKKTDQWPTKACPRCKHGCCMKAWHHVGSYCMHCGVDER